MKHTTATLLICLLTSGIVAAGESGRIEIRLQSSVHTASPVVRLSDVATIVGGHDMLRQVIVLPANSGPGSRSITMNQVQKALRKAGFNPIPMRFCGAACCTVTSGSATLPGPVRKPTTPTTPTTPAASATTRAANAKPVPTTVRPAARAKPTTAAQTLGDLVRRQMLAELGGRPEDITFTFSRSSGSHADIVPDGVTEIVSTDRNRLGKRRWRTNYTLGGRPHSRYLTATVTGRRDVLVATRAMSVGETIAAADIETARRVDAGTVETMSDAAIVVGQQIRKSLVAGQAITAAHLTAPMLVQRGQTVWVTCGPVRMPAKALGKGLRGESVEFENPRSKKRFRAVVTGPGQAAMTLMTAVATREVQR